MGRAAGRRRKEVWAGEPCIRVLLLQGAREITMAVQNEREGRWWVGE